MARGDRNRGQSIAMVFLLNQLFRTATTYGIPPVTAIFIAGQVLLYLGFIQTPWTDSWDVCISVDKAWFKKDYKRIIFSAFEHGDDWHLYYNMVSFMWKGRQLEQKFGPLRFVLILITFTIGTSFTYMGINYFLATSLDDWSYFRSCAVGFSAVIFALKVLCTHDTHETSSFMGLSVPSKYVFWFELIYISMITPNASFVGHLAGILVGLAYVHGPLKIFIDTIEQTISGERTSRSSSRRFDSSGTAGSGEDYDEDLWRATEESLRQPRPTAPPYPTHTTTSPPYPTHTTTSPPYPTYIHPDPDDLRRRRAERFTTSGR